MPEMNVVVGGKNFTVACQDGEEQFLTSAAAMLDREAQALLGTGARLTTERMLLMAGLMLADRALSSEEELRTMDRRLAQQAKTIEDLEARPAPPVQVREVLKEVDVEKVPDALVGEIDALLQRAEGLAKTAG